MEGKLGSTSVEGVGKLEKSEEEAGRPQGGKEEKKQETEGAGKAEGKESYKVNNKDCSMGPRGPWNETSSYDLPARRLLVALRGRGKGSLCYEWEIRDKR